MPVSAHWTPPFTTSCPHRALPLVLPVSEEAEPERDPGWNQTAVPLVRPLGEYCLASKGEETQSQATACRQHGPTLFPEQ